MANIGGKAVQNCKITAPHDIRQKQGGRWNLCAYQNICAKAMRPSENWRPNSASAYYLGSAESPTADFFQVWLKSSHSGDVASRSCSPQVTWALRPPSLYGRRLSRTVPADRLLYRHDLSKYLRLVQISAGAYIFTISWGKVKKLSRLISVLPLPRNFVHDHKSCPNLAATLLSP